MESTQPHFSASSPLILCWAGSDLTREGEGHHFSPSGGVGGHRFSPSGGVGSPFFSLRRGGVTTFLPQEGWGHHFAPSGGVGGSPFFSDHPCCLPRALCPAAVWVEQNGPSWLCWWHPSHAWNYLDNLVKIQLIWLCSEVLFRMVCNSDRVFIFIKLSG